MNTNLIKRESTYRLSRACSKVSSAEEEAGERYGSIMYTEIKFLPPVNFDMSQASVADFVKCLNFAMVFQQFVYTNLHNTVQKLLVALRKENILKNVMMQTTPPDNSTEPSHFYGRKKTIAERAIEAIQQAASIMDNTQQGETESDNDDDFTFSFKRKSKEMFWSDDDMQATMDSDAEFTVDMAMKKIFSNEYGTFMTSLPPTTMRRTLTNSQANPRMSSSWLVILCELPSIKFRKIAIVQLNNSTYIMPTCKRARCIVLILANSMEKGLKNTLETGLKFATLMSLRCFIPLLKNATDDTEIRAVFHTCLERCMVEDHQLPNFVSQTTATESLGGYQKRFCPPLNGIREDFSRRMKYYLSDFSDGIVGYNTVLKLLSAIVFHYFTTILTIVVLGHSVNVITKGSLTTKSLLYAQFVGSIIYAIFSGQPMMMFQVSPVILLYAKVVYNFTQEQESDFLAVFSFTGIFSGFLLILIGVFNLANIMVYATSSIAESVDIFQSLTFCVMAFKDFREVYMTSYNCDFKKLECHPETFLLDCFVVLMTMSLGIALQHVRSLAIFNMQVREFISDMSFSIAVLVSAFTASFLFAKVPLHPVCYVANSTVYEIGHLHKISPKPLAYSFLLAVPLMLLIFLDHNLNSEFLMDPRNKLQKGCAIHLDMFVVGSINCLLGVFGMPSLQGMFPQTPLHIKQMADSEIRVDGGVTDTKLIRVRDNRLTQLAVGTLVGVSIFLLPLPINYIPRAALDALLICIALVSLKGNPTIDRLRLIIQNQSAFPVDHQLRRIPTTQIHKFTFLQSIQLGIACCMCFYPNTAMNVLFPVAIFMMLPVRQLIVPRFFSREYLELLDPTKLTEEGNVRGCAAHVKPKNDA